MQLGNLNWLHRETPPLTLERHVIGRNTIVAASNSLGQWSQDGVDAGLSPYAAALVGGLEESPQGVGQLLERIRKRVRLNTGDMQHPTGAMSSEMQSIGVTGLNYVFKSHYVLSRPAFHRREQLEQDRKQLERDRQQLKWDLAWMETQIYVVEWSEQDYERFQQIQARAKQVHERLEQYRGRLEEFEPASRQFSAGTVPSTLSEEPEPPQIISRALKPLLTATSETAQPPKIS